MKNDTLRDRGVTGACGAAAVDEQSRRNGGSVRKTRSFNQTKTSSFGLQNSTVWRCSGYKDLFKRCLQQKRAEEENLRRVERRITKSPQLRQ
ncbi:hypothetical protein KOW79_014351 [Hemibagrus wyckioides]|uniref:Uncharacterized protein n=1 Tax=Hemibagrus wyckioides TaxID=337641 RepID=A0A9D3NJ42_9TELE|nr:hypothetical protein KOW79_014351 [Hemibagrus wyckioides]